MSEVAKRMFNAYNEAGPTPWVTFDGRPVPKWEDLNDSVRAKWEAAALAARDAESLDVLEFMRKFGQTFKRADGTELEHRPRHLTLRKLNERVDFIREELKEFTDAMNVQDLPEMADALVDMVYVIKGTANMLGLPWAALWNDVQRANMEKVRGVGKRGNLVDCIKPPGWNPPKTEAILAAFGYGSSMMSLFALWDDPEYCPDGPRAIQPQPGDHSPQCNARAAENENSPCICGKVSNG